jgi:hypothetical protein
MNGWEDLFKALTLAGFTSTDIYRLLSYNFRGKLSYLSKVEKDRPLTEAEQTLQYKMRGASELFKN